MSAKQTPVVLIDGSSYLYRAYHALPPLTNSKGQPTGAIYGVINMVKRLISDYNPEKIAVVFDAKGKTFRDELYQAYKANREAMPEDLAKQIPALHNIIKAMGIPLIMVSGVEADDVIGTLATQAANKKEEILISTSDKDLAQLVNSHVTLINTMSNTMMTPKGVEEKFGVPPERIIDYLTLVGDTSDNIPGVPKVGPKTAAKWLQTYGSLDEIIKCANEIKGKVGDNLREFIDKIPLTKQLVTIKKDVELPFQLSDIEKQSPDNDALTELFRDMEFKSWLSELLKKQPEMENTKKPSTYETITTEQQLDHWLKELKSSDLFAFDTETTSLNYMQARIVGMSFATAAGKAAYLPFGHCGEDNPTQLDANYVIERIKPILEDQHQRKIGQNIKYDMEVLANHGIQLRGIAFDTMIESYVLDSTANNHNMDAMSLKYLGHRTVSYEDVAGKGAKQITFDKVTLDKAAHYAAEDADVTLQLHQTLWPKLEKEKSLVSVFKDIEMPLIPVLASIERNGVLIDPVKLETQSSLLEKRLGELEKQAFELAETEFNLNSPKQLQEVLFEKMNLPVIQKTPTGQPSTADAVLQELALEFALPSIIIEYRSISKLISTYTSKLPKQINADTGRVHTSYNQTVTATGRLSSSDPNLQNIPVRTEEGRRIRQAFIAPEGYQLVSADYSQIELRLMAHISGDPALLNAFAKNLDIHKATAAEVWDVPLDKVTSEMRRNAKAINFGLIYGMSAFGLSKQLGINRQDAQSYIDTYFERYPKVREYMENTREKAHETGYVETLWGRRLYLPDINAKQIPRQRAAERTAINAPLQGSAADIIKMAMIKINDWLDTCEIDAKMIMQVHDELVFEVAHGDTEKLKNAIDKYMKDVVKLDVPLLVSIGTGDNWDSASAH